MAQLWNAAIESRRLAFGDDAARLLVTDYVYHRRMVEDGYRWIDVE